MPQVPYSGVPTVAPGGEPTPRYQADVKPESFGVNVWQSVQNLGQTANKVGDELFARGIAMQDLYNHSVAQQADADYMQKAGELHANFSSLQGKAAVDAYPQYIEDLKAARSKISGGLPNEMAQKLFDSQSLSTMGRTIFNGAGHAGQQNKVYANQTSAAKVDAISNQVLANPKDEDAFQDGLQDAEDEVRFQFKDMGDDVADQKWAQKKSELWSERIKGMKNEPNAAQKMLDQAIKDGDIQGEDIAKMTNLVQGWNHTVGARIISHNINTGADGRWGQGPVDIRSAQRAISRIESGSAEGNYTLIGPETRSMGHALGRYQVMSANLQDWLKQSGLPAMSEKEFLQNHNAQDTVFSTIFGGYMNKYGSANAAAVAWFAGESRAANPKSWSDPNITDATATTRGTPLPGYLARFNAGLAQDAPLSQKYAMGERIATENHPNDPLMADAVRDRLASDQHKQIEADRSDKFQNQNTIETELMGGQSGKIPTTVDELTADPKASQAWDWLNQNYPAKARYYLGVLAKNAKGDHNWNDASLRQYQGFKGEAATDPASFLDRDVIGTDLPNSAKRELINLQQRLKAKSEADPRVTRALAILGPDMQAAGIDKKDKDNYNQFVGALSDQLQQSAEENKRPPKIDEVKLIGARLMQSQTRPGLFGMFFGGTQTPTFQVPVPKDEAEKIRLDPTWAKLGITPTDTQIQRIYTRKLYQDLYGGTPKSQSTTAQAQAPVSQ